MKTKMGKIQVRLEKARQEQEKRERVQKALNETRLPKHRKKPASDRKGPTLIASNRLDFDLDFMWGDEAP